jgi:hypothetical protein
MPAPDIIQQLVKRFEQSYELYRLLKYNEMQVCRVLFTEQFISS